MILAKQKAEGKLGKEDTLEDSEPVPEEEEDIFASFAPPTLNRKASKIDYFSKESSLDFFYL